MWETFVKLMTGQMQLAKWISLERHCFWSSCRHILHTWSKADPNHFCLNLWPRQETTQYRKHRHAHNIKKKSHQNITCHRWTYKLLTTSHSIRHDPCCRQSCDPNVVISDGCRPTFHLVQCCLCLFLCSEPFLWPNKLKGISVTVVLSYLSLLFFNYIYGLLDN